MSRFFPPPFEEDMPEKSTIAPQDYLDCASAIIEALYTVPQTVQAGPSSAHLSSLSTAIDKRQSSAFCSADLPRPLNRLLVVLVHRLTPLPSSLRINLRGPAPTDETSGIANLLPFVDQVERALIAAANASPAAEQYVSRMRDLPREAKRHAEQERRVRTAQEKERRRAVDRLRGRVAGEWQSADANTSDAEEVTPVAAARTDPALPVRLEDQYGREIAMVRSRARTVRSKTVIDSEDELDAENGLAAAAAGPVGQTWMAGGEL